MRTPEGEERQAPSEEAVPEVEIKEGDTPTQVAEKIRWEDGYLDPQPAC